MSTCVLNELLCVDGWRSRSALGWLVGSTGQRSGMHMLIYKEGKKHRRNDSWLKVPQIQAASLTGPHSLV